MHKTRIPSYLPSFFTQFSLLLCICTLLSLPAVAQNNGLITHKVKSGDTLYGISRTYGLTISEIRALNGLRGNTIQPGQILIVGSQSSEQSISSEDELVPFGSFKVHQMQRRQDLDEVLALYKMSIYEFELLNPGLVTEAIVTGTKVNVFEGPDSLQADPYAPKVDTDSLALSVQAVLFPDTLASTVTRSGQLYNPQGLIVAFDEIPIGHLVRLKNPSNQQTIIAQVLDRVNETGKMMISPKVAQQLQISGQQAPLLLLSSFEF